MSEGREAVLEKAVLRYEDRDSVQKLNRVRVSIPEGSLVPEVEA